VPVVLRVDDGLFATSTIGQRQIFLERRKTRQLTSGCGTERLHNLSAVTIKPALHFPAIA
jgi:hypothetical protein